MACLPGRAGSSSIVQARQAGSPAASGGGRSSTETSNTARTAGHKSAPELEVARPTGRTRQARARRHLVVVELPQRPAQPATRYFTPTVRFFKSHRRYDWLSSASRPVQAPMLRSQPACGRYGGFRSLPGPATSPLRSPRESLERPSTRSSPLAGTSIRRAEARGGPSPRR
jgi:hypothetical protein